MVVAKLFQLFQPMGGVAARIVIGRSVLMWITT
jgi:hypothetical protein